MADVWLSTIYGHAADYKRSRIPQTKKGKTRKTAKQVLKNPLSVFLFF